MKAKILLLGIAVAILSLGFGTSEAHANGAVSGVVIDADGEPVGGAVVSITGRAHQRGERPFRARFETNDNGTFGFRDVPAGHYHIIGGAREVGMARARIEVQDDEVTNVELQLRGRVGRGGGDREDDDQPDPGSVTGQIVNADGDPVAGAIVAVVSQDRRRHRGRARGARTRTDDQGMFTFENVHEGNYLVLAWARGVGRAREAIEVTAGEETEVNLTLQGR